MTRNEATFSDLMKLLGRSEADPQVVAYFGNLLRNVKRDEYYGSLDIHSLGLEIVFREAEYVLEPEKIVNPKELYMSAVHLHGAGHDGYPAYGGVLPNGVRLGDLESDVVQKMGEPSESGGEVYSDVLKRKLPRWLRYKFHNIDLQFQMGLDSRLEMITLSFPEPASGENDVS